VEWLMNLIVEIDLAIARLERHKAILLGAAANGSSQRSRKTAAVPHKRHKHAAVKARAISSSKVRRMARRKPRSSAPSGII
jgi:hypothetical protein